MIDYGKWSQPGVPQKGWTCTGSYDSCENGEEIHRVCEMCERQPIRYVHVMGHDDYPGPLECGCDCAAKMGLEYTAGLQAARERERVLKLAAQKRIRDRKRQEAEEQRARERVEALARWEADRLARYEREGGEERSRFADDSGWKTSRRGTPYINVDGYHIVVFERRHGGWGVGISPLLREGETMWGRRTYRTEREARLGAYDALKIMPPPPAAEDFDADPAWIPPLEPMEEEAR
jgi:hypothetical protein